MRFFVVTGLLAMVVAGCNAPRPEGVAGCSDDFYRFDRDDPQGEGRGQVTDYSAERIGNSPDRRKLYEGMVDAINQIPAGTREEPGYVHVLVLSGGGAWGAYGAGFLNGWRIADSLTGGEYASRSSIGYPRQRRSDIHIVAGISTGAAQAPAAYVGATTEAQVARNADRRLAEQYTAVSEDSLIRMRFGGKASALFSNSIYSVDGIEDQSRKLVDSYFDVIKSMPVSKRIYVGTLNVDRNRFVVADLKAMADRSVESSKAQAKACVAQSLLASAAVPLAFPPRFIDGEMYVDGNVRHGVFATLLFGDRRVRKAMRDRHLLPYVSVIVNGNQSADSYRDSKERHEVKNGALAIVGAAVSNMLDQVAKDSTYQIENDLIALFGANGEQINYFSRYTYVDNAAIRAADFAECRAARASTNDQIFDPVFMKCLYNIGFEAAQSQEADRMGWRDFFRMPPPAPPPPG